jgi:hypothetical protein
MAMVNNAVRVPCNDLNTFFKYWLLFLEPFHKMSTREIEVAACFLKHRYLYSLDVLNPTIVEKLSMNEETKRIIAEECNLTSAYFQVMMSKLRKSKFVIDGKINPRFIPNVSSENFSLLIHFEINNFNGQDV